MMKFTSEIDGSIVPELEEFFAENAVQNCTIEHLSDTSIYTLCGYFENFEDWNGLFSALRSKFPTIKDFEQEDVGKTDWQNEYKKYCKPWKFQKFCWVPTWMRDEFLPPKGSRPVYIDSSAAFGTGMHETTRLCAKALELFAMMYNRDAALCIKKCLDVGCGTGILGITALKLGMQKSIFIDNDEQAIKVCQENVAENDISSPDQVEYVQADLRIGLLGKQGDLVLANILANVLMDNADILVRSVRAGGLLCLSGILVDEMDAVRDVFKPIIKRLWDASLENNAKIGQWGSLMFSRA